MEIFQKIVFMKILMEFHDFSNSDIFPTLKNMSNILNYSGITHKNLILTKLSIDFILFRTCFINYKKYQDYKPEKFCINNIIFNI